MQDLQPLERERAICRHLRLSLRLRQLQEQEEEEDQEKSRWLRLPSLGAAAVVAAAVVLVADKWKGKETFS